MTIQDFMDRTEVNHTRMAIQYLKDGIREMQLLSDEFVQRANTDLVKDQRRYSMPDGMITMKNVRILDSDSGKYIPIPRLIGVITDEA